MADGLNSQDLQIQLDTAQTDLHYVVRGKYIAIDAASTGQASLKLNSTANLSRLVYPGTVLTQPFTDLFFTFAAQPGKILHVIYGDNPDILAAGQKFSIDPAIAPSVLENYQIASAINILITAGQNINGIKILGGFLVAQAAPVAGAIAAVDLHYVSAGNAIIIGSAKTSYSGSALITFFDTFIIPAYYIPAGKPLVMDTSIVGGGAGSLTLNY
ncbi:MAG: hypothetical protein KGJ13_06340, partial [Patescibacteria group bacterium]|nr:hypothetical protein [Patescibacteria group bacterium]